MEYTRFVPKKLLLYVSLIVNLTLVLPSISNEDPLLSLRSMFPIALVVCRTIRMLIVPSLAKETPVTCGLVDNGVLIVRLAL